jgi:hypothetical protein
MSVEKIPTNLELLNLAKELAYADYNNRRANMHNQWLVDNETMKRTRGISVPYPPIPQYPSEEEIIDRAKKLIDFLNQPRSELETQEVRKGVNKLISDVTQESRKEPVLEKPIVQEPKHITKKDKIQDTKIEESVETNVSPIEESVETPVESQNKSSMFKKLKTAWTKDDKNEK